MNVFRILSCHMSGCRCLACKVWGFFLNEKKTEGPKLKGRPASLPPPPAAGKLKKKIRQTKYSKIN